MNENLIIPENVQQILTAIESVQKFWAEYPLQDHADLPQFNRKIVVSGFNLPDLTEENNQKLEITVRQLFINKESGSVFINKRQPIWTISTDTWSYMRNPENASQLIEVDKQIFDEEGNPDGTEKSNIKVSTIDYMKFLLFNKYAHLTDLFSMYLKDFAIAKETELNQL